MMKYRGRQRCAAGIGLMMTLAMLLSGCVTKESKAITVMVNGKQVPSAEDRVRMVNGRLYATVAFMNQELGLELDAAELSLENKLYFSDQVAILMYHHLEEVPSSTSRLSVKAFEQQMELLKQEGFNVISMAEYKHYMLESAKVPDNAVLLTFDDGYESFYQYAYPTLQKYGYTATNFIIVAAIDERTGVPKLTWEQMREMKRAGMSFYSHTYDSHHYGEKDREGNKGPVLKYPLYLPSDERVETAMEYEARVKQDMEYAEKRLREELSNEDNLLAFPYGAYNDQVLAILEPLGFPLTFTITPGLNTRANKQAYRYNAGSSAVTVEEWMNSLKQGWFAGEKRRIEVSLNGKVVSFNQSQPSVIDGQIYIPLLEMSRMTPYELSWNSKEKQAEFRMKAEQE